MIGKIKNSYMLFFIIIMHSLLISGQNYISNSSFSDVNIIGDTSTFYKIDFNEKSNVSDWYIPSYFKQDGVNSDDLVSYFSSRHIEHHKKRKIITNSEELFNNNLGFVRIYAAFYMTAALQQALRIPNKENYYCLKFKYKRCQLQNLKGDDLDFSFSATDLHEYYNGHFLEVPDSLISFTFNDSINNSIDIPWQQKGGIIKLSGKEKYLTIGSLRHSKKEEPQNKFYIDDISLRAINDSNKACDCENVSKIIAAENHRKYPVNKILNSEALALYAPYNVTRIDHMLISPSTKSTLENIIAFMQKNPNVKIKFIEYDRFNSKNKNQPKSYLVYKYFMNFYGITDNRISTKWGHNFDKDDKYFGFNSELIKMAFMFF
jgi:hypothetical protein